MTKTIYYQTVETKLGPLTVLIYGKNVIRIDFGSLEQVKDKAHSWLKRYFPQRTFQKDKKKTKEVLHQLEEYFSLERRIFSLPLKIYGTPFQRAVWKSTADLVPYGKTCSYKDVAIDLQREKAVRAIGGALNKNPISIVIPCHRVIGSNGQLVGYGGGLERKEFLLELEHLSSKSPIY